MKLQYNTEKTIIGIVPLIQGNGGNYVTVNLAYEYSEIFKKQNKKIAIINMRKNKTVSDKFIISINKDESTTHLKYDIDLFENIKNKKEYDKIKNLYDIIIVELDFNQIELFNSFAKNKTMILILKRNINNLKIVEENIAKIKENFKYYIFNCYEKTNKIDFNILKENNIINILKIPYNEFTVDNCNIEKSHKLNKIKYIKLFKKIIFTKVKIKK